MLSGRTGYTHDRDYLAFKKKPVGRAAGRNRAWTLGTEAQRMERHNPEHFKHSKAKVSSERHGVRGLR